MSEATGEAVFADAEAKAVALDNSVLFDVHRWSDYPEVKVATDRLFGVIGPYFSST